MSGTGCCLLEEGLCGGGGSAWTGKERIIFVYAPPLDTAITILPSFPTRGRQNHRCVRHEGGHLLYSLAARIGACWVVLVFFRSLDEIMEQKMTLGHMPIQKHV